MSRPRRFNAIMDAVGAADRDYFANHPTENFYVRDYIPGEMWPCEFPQRTAMLVRRLLRGNTNARTRQAIPNQSAAQLHAILADRTVTVFAPSNDGNRLEALDEWQPLDAEA